MNVLSGYDHVIELDGTVLRAETYRRGLNAYVRWETDEREGEYGGVVGDDFVFDINEYLKSGGRSSESVEIPSEFADELNDELDELRQRGFEELDDEEREALETEKRVIARARQILEEDGLPELPEFETYSFEHEDSVGGSHSVEVGVEPRAGVAEVVVETAGSRFYSPSYDLEEGVVSLPASEWGFRYEVGVPDEVADELLDDLIELQEELNERREVYDDAVRKARDEVASDG